MKMRRWSIVFFWIAVGPVVGFPADPTWKAGAARRIITPEAPMWMAGYASRHHPAEGTSTELYCKALLLEDPDGQRGLVITLDLVGIDAELAGDCIAGRSPYALPTRIADRSSWGT